MRLKSTCFIILLLSTSCAEQIRWRNTKGEPSVGEVVYEVTAKGVEQSNSCKTERTHILQNHKDQYIGAINSVYTAVMSSKTDTTIADDFLKIVNSDGERFAKSIVEFLETVIEEFIKPQSKRDLLKDAFDVKLDSIALGGLVTIHKSAAYIFAENIFHHPDFQSIALELSEQKFDSNNTFGKFIAKDKVNIFFQECLEQTKNNSALNSEEAKEFLRFLENIMVMTKIGVNTNNWLVEQLDNPTFRMWFIDRILNRIGIPERLVLGKCFINLVKDNKFGSTFKALNVDSNNTDNSNNESDIEQHISDMIKILSKAIETTNNDSIVKEYKGLQIHRLINFLNRAASLASDINSNKATKDALMSIYNVFKEIQDSNTTTESDATLRLIMDYLKLYKTKHNNDTTVIDIVKSSITTTATKIFLGAAKIAPNIALGLVPDALKEKLSEVQVTMLADNFSTLIEQGFADELYDFINSAVTAGYLKFDDTLIAPKNTSTNTIDIFNDVVLKLLESESVEIIKSLKVSFDKVQEKLPTGYSIESSKARIIDAITLVKKLFPKDTSFRDAQISLIGDVLIKLYSAREEDKCIVKDSLSSKFDALHVIVSDINGRILQMPNEIKTYGKIQNAPAA